MTEKTKKFISKLYEKRPDLINNLYLIDEYIDNKTKIRFKDKYGVLLIKPSQLLFFKNKPSILLAEDKTKYYITRVIEIYGDKYDYTLVNYVTNRDSIEVKCNKHGIFKVTPDNHLRGIECAKCQARRNSDLMIEKAKNLFFDKAKLKHNGKYDYSKFKYELAIKKSIIICPIHGEFTQDAHNHLNGKGCRKCAISANKLKCKGNGIYNITTADRNKDKWLNIKANLYVIKCIGYGEEFYKIGVCKASNKIKRLKGLKYKVEVLSIFESNLYNVVIIEQDLHKKLNKYKYTPNIKMGGHNECYDIKSPINTILLDIDNIFKL
jgi:hypothetical protein